MKLFHDFHARNADKSVIHDMLGLNKIIGVWAVGRLTVSYSSYETQTYIRRRKNNMQK